MLGQTCKRTAQGPDLRKFVPVRRRAAPTRLRGRCRDPTWHRGSELHYNIMKYYILAISRYIYIDNIIYISYWFKGPVYKRPCAYHKNVRAKRARESEWWLVELLAGYSTVEGHQVAVQYPAKGRVDSTTLVSSCDRKSPHPASCRPRAGSCRLSGPGTATWHGARRRTALVACPALFAAHIYTVYYTRVQKAMDGDTGIAFHRAVVEALQLVEDAKITRNLFKASVSQCFAGFSRPPSHGLQKRGHEVLCDVKLSLLSSGLE